MKPDLKETLHPFVDNTSITITRPNFVSNGKVYLVRCPECKTENYAPCVASGECAWCGFNGNTLNLNYDNKTPH